MTNTSFVFLNKEKTDETLRVLFDILYSNMHIIVPTGESYETDRQMWTSTVRNALKNPRRNIIVIKMKHEIIGFFMYSVSGDLFKMEEIQFKQKYHGSGLFRELFCYLLTLVPEEICYVEAFANKANVKSQNILAHLKLERVGENKTGNLFRYVGRYEDMKRVIVEE